MAGYMTFWSKERVRQLEKAGDTGPLRVIYGSHHACMPTIAGVREGDIIYPVALSQGALYVMARLPVEKVEPAFDYLMRETGYYYSSLIPEGVMAIEKGPHCTMLLQADGPVRCDGELPPDDGSKKRIILNRDANFPHKCHQEPYSCCASLAASGEHGSGIRPRPIPQECIPLLRFGPTKSKEKALILDKNGRATVHSLGSVRRMGEDTWQQFEALFPEESCRVHGG